MAFELKVRIYYEDTDAGGIVYHSNYLKYAERARTEYLNSLGIPHKMVYGMIVTNAALRYRKPAYLADELTVVTELEKINAASCELSQNIYRDDVLLVEINIKIAFVNKELKPARMPEEIRKAMEKDMKRCIT